jgi:hypothetical protein
MPGTAVMPNLNNNGVTYGKSKKSFAPDDAITRAEFTLSRPLL